MCCRNTASGLWVLKTVRLAAERWGGWRRCAGHAHAPAPAHPVARPRCRPARWQVGGGAGAVHAVHRALYHLFGHCRPELQGESRQDMGIEQEAVAVRGCMAGRLAVHLVGTALVVMAPRFGAYFTASVCFAGVRVARCACGVMPARSCWRARVWAPPPPTGAAFSADVRPRCAR